MSSYHTSVLLHESIEALAIKPNGIYVDATMGGAGHTIEILKLLGPEGKLIAFDQDEDAEQNCPSDPRLLFVASNFRHLLRFLRLHSISKVDGILADLGVSSYQFDTGQRGFSYRFDGNLDMRMNQRTGKTAADILQTYNAEQLQQMFSMYGEVSNAKTLSQAIVAARSIKAINNIPSFVALLEPLVKGNKYSYLAQVFQALRIEVNDEIEVLKNFLEQCATALKPGGRLAIISFHSLEDRIIKQYMKRGTFEDEHIKDEFGTIYLPFKVVHKKAIEASKEELLKNKRSHSAKLRVAERTAM